MKVTWECIVFKNKETALMEGHVNVFFFFQHTYNIKNSIILFLMNTYLWQCDVFFVENMYSCDFIAHMLFLKIIYIYIYIHLDDLTLRSYMYFLTIYRLLWPYIAHMCVLKNQKQNNIYTYVTVHCTISFFFKQYTHICDIPLYNYFYNTDLCDLPLRTYPFFVI